ncbi:MAG: hypothetical protein D6681_22070, partial [Calditrichaeota bacterium]
TSGVDYKHLRWNDDAGEYLLERTFTVKPQDNQTAQFKDLNKTITIENNLLSGGGAQGDIEFNDPWFVEADNGQPGIFHTYSSPFTPGSGVYAPYRGVFLDQPFTGNNPHYLVRAADAKPFSVNGKSITWDWESWSYNTNQIDLQSPNSKTTAVVFKQDGATLTANLKGRRASDTPAATAGNNAYKIAAHPAASNPNHLYQVYIDHGQVYFTESTDAGQTWTKDRRLNIVGQQCLNPGISVDKNGIVHVIYEEQWDNNGQLVYDVYHTMRDGNGLWSTPEALSNLLDYSGYGEPTTPAIYAEYNGNVFAVWKSNNPYNSGLVLKYRLLGVNWSQAQVVPNTDVNSFTPAISYGSVGISPYFTQIVWEDRSADVIKHITGDYVPGSGWTWGSTENINGGSNLFDQKLPSIYQKVGGYPQNLYAVWQATEKGGATASPLSPQPPLSLCPPASKDNPVVCFAEKSSSNWQSFTYFRVTNTCDRNPVVTAWVGAIGNDVAIAFEGIAGEIHYILRQDCNWMDVTVMSTDGNYPALTATSGTPHLIWTEKQQRPYRILHSDQLLTPMNTNGSPPHSREITFRLSRALPDSQLLPVDGNVTVEIADPLYTAGGTSQPVPPLFRDSLLTPQNGFQYQNILVNHPSATLQVPVIIRADSLTPLATPKGSGGLQSAFLALRLNDGRTHATLLTLHTYLRDIFNSDTLGSFVITDTFTVALDAFVNREVQVEGQVYFKKRNLKAVVAEVYDLRNRGNRMQQPLLARAGNT